SGPTGVEGSGTTYGVYGTTSAYKGFGVFGEATGSTSYGVVATGSLMGINAIGPTAGRFDGNVLVIGSVSATVGYNSVDHPLDPATKTLAHSFVGSPEMLNVYSGTVTLDRNGSARVILPRYFEALNREFRYQLTAVGAPAPGLHVASKVKNGR